MSEVTAERIEVPSPALLLEDINDYDHIIVSESGGKDSVACLFDLENQGVDMSKVELWHQCIDDREAFMDWPTMESYVQALGDLYKIPVYFQWRDGGFKGELLRKDSLKGDVHYYNGDGLVTLPTDKGRTDGRQKFPALSSDLRYRWCSSVLKIDVGRRVISNDPRFAGTREQPKRILFVSGERRDESLARAGYDEVKLHDGTNTRTRTVHHWRMVIDRSEDWIWQEYEKRKFRPAPPYVLGWNRTSCFGCIFSTPDLWAMMREIAPARFEAIAQMEIELGHTIDPRMSVVEKANKGKTDRLPKGEKLNNAVRTALDHSFRFKASDLIMDKWELPAGAFRGSEGGSL
jgi:hypothetical protein